MKNRFPLASILLLVAAAVAFVAIAQVIHVRLVGSVREDWIDKVIWGVGMAIGCLLPIKKYTQWKDQQQRVGASEDGA
jgi:hypothetical protein